MKIENVRIFLETICEYHTVKITQTFTSKDGRTLSVRCLPGTRTLEISELSSQKKWRSESVEETAALIINLLESTI